MTTTLTTSTDCGSGTCTCSGSASEPGAPAASINGIALHAAGAPPDALTLKELAYGELLRQQAVQSNLLPLVPGLIAPELSEQERQTIETMVERAVVTPQPTEEECRRYYEANRAKYVVGQGLHLRHILFAVTPGVNVQALAVHAEKALLELLHKDAPDGLFEKRAAELSNCPTSTQGGDLGWVGPDECAPELAKELFHQSNTPWSLGVHTRLVHTRFGFHIIEVLERREGRQLGYEEVHQRVAAQLAMQSRAKALHQYMSLLVGEATVQGVELEWSDSPLVQ